MTFEQVANFIRDDVASAVGQGDGTIDVPDASLFPDPTEGEYHLVLWNQDEHPLPSSDPDVEIVAVTDRDTSADTLTVTRGMEGTDDVAHAETSVVQLSPTAALLQTTILREAAPGDTAAEGELAVSADNDLLLAQPAED